MGWNYWRSCSWRSRNITCKISTMEKREISKELYERLDLLGLLDTDLRGHNVGASDYSQHVIQPWSIWIDWDLNPWDADIVKRVLRKKKGESRKMDYQKIIHICQERIRQEDAEERNGKVR